MLFYCNSLRAEVSELISSDVGSSSVALQLMNAMPKAISSLYSAMNFESM